MHTRDVGHYYNSPNWSSRGDYDPRVKTACYLTMLDLIKTQATPQFNWYTCWTSLGADGMPDKLIEESLKRPDWIKISFKKGSTDITGHVVPD